MKGKTLRNLFSLVLAFTLILCMGTTAFAANVSINNPNGNTYTVWKVMTAENKGTMANPAWRYTVTSEFEGFFNDHPYGLNADGEIIYADEGEVVKVDTDGRWTNVNDTEAARLAAALKNYAISHNLTGTEIKNSTAVTLEDGYYVIAETETKSGTKTVASKPILLSVAGDSSVTITPKTDTTDLEKVILEGDEEKKSNTANIGDVINYQVTTKIPTYEANVDKTTLKFKLTDTFSTGLTYNEDLSIAGFSEETDYTASYEDGVLTIEFTPDGIYDNQGKAVVLTYSATLNENAVVDSENGNPNEIELEFTNNPDEENGSDKLTDEVKTYTYGFKIHKTDTNDDTKMLNGAEFTLADSEGITINFTKSGNVYTVNPQGDEDKIVTSNTAYTTIKGLAAGTYTLTETKAPDGYALLDGAITIIIEDADDDGNPTGIATFSASGAGDASVAFEKADGTCEGPAEGETTVTEDGDSKVEVHVEIKNQKGISLPETGAKTALYCMIGGAVIALFGCVFFFGGKRKKEVK